MVETLDFAKPEFYTGIYVTFKTLLTCATERSFSSLKRRKTKKYSKFSFGTLANEFCVSDATKYNEFKRKFCRVYCEFCVTL